MQVFQRTFEFFFVGIISCLLSLQSFAEEKDSDVAFLKLKKSTLKITNGSGFLVYGKSGKKYIITNWHVCVFEDRADQLVAFMTDGVTLFGSIRLKDPKRDLCAAEIETSAPGLILSSQLLPSERVFTRGYPRGILSESSGNFVKDEYWQTIFFIEEVGICPRQFKRIFNRNSNLVGCQALFHSNITTLYSRPGSSGSPVVNLRGELVGVISSWMNGDDDAAGMVNFEDLTEFLSRL